MIIRNMKVLFLVLLAAFLGLLCVAVPPYLFPGGIAVRYDAPLAPMLKTAYENLAFFTSLSCFFFVGIFLGVIQPRKWLVVTASTILIFPIIIALEIAISPSSHNLWPVEIGIYLLFGLASVVGGYIGRNLRRQYGTERGGTY